MRTINPNQELASMGSYETSNFVQYQPLSGDGADSLLDRSYVHPVRHQASLVVFTGAVNLKMYGALGAVHPNGRVNTFDFESLDPVRKYGDGQGDR